MSQLVVITGPIASGKSTVARGLTEHCRNEGRSAVAVDLDDVVTMLRAPLDRFERSWQQARKVHGEFVAAWLDAGVDVVIAHGPFYTDDETAALLGPVPATITPRRVMLLASLETAVAGVTMDVSRKASRDPEFLRATHDRFQRLLPKIAACEWVFDTATVSADHVVMTIGSAIDREGPRGSAICPP